MAPVLSPRATSKTTFDLNSPQRLSATHSVSRRWLLEGRNTRKARSTGLSVDGRSITTSRVPFDWTRTHGR